MPFGGADLSPPSFPFSLSHSSPRSSLMLSFARLSLHTHSFTISFPPCTHSRYFTHSFTHPSLTLRHSFLLPSFTCPFPPSFISSFLPALLHSLHHLVISRTTFLVPSSLLPCLHLSIAPTLVHSVFLSFLPSFIARVRPSLSYFLASLFTGPGISSLFLLSL